MDLKRTQLLGHIRDVAYHHSPDYPLTLKSGEVSPHYVDCRQLLLEPQYLELAAATLAEAIQAEGVPLEFVAGVVVGACSLVTALSLKLNVPGVFVRAEAKEHATRNLVEMGASLLDLRGPQRGILLEDVITTGKSAQKAIDNLKAARLDTDSVWSLVTRASGRPTALQVRAYSLFSLDQIIAFSRD